MKVGMFMCGGVDTIVQKFEEYQKQIGFGYLLTALQFGTLPHDLAMKNMKIFGEKVIPRLRHLAEEPSPRAKAV
jgi:hypothetical protein